MDANPVARHMTPYLPQATPLPVEITNQTDWWQPYVPPLVGLVGSILAAVVALYSVHKSNGTNERAIDAADNRELEKWRRDNLLRIWVIPFSPWVFRLSSVVLGYPG